MKNKNILELCLADGLGGLEIFVANCYEHFSLKSTCKIVVAPRSKLDYYLGNIDKFHIKRNKIFPFISAFKLAKYIDKNDIDIVHFHWTRDIVTAVLAKVLSKKKPKLVQSRHMRMTRFKDDFYHRWLYKNINIIHAVTKDVAKQLVKFIPSEIRPKIEMIYLGVKASKIDKARVFELRQKYNIKDEFIVGIVGRIEAEKGQYKVLEAIAKLKDLKIKGIIVGSFMNDMYEKELKLYTKNLDIAEKILFTGFTKEVDEHMQLFDVNVLATENETFGLVVVEAMANKVPMIASNKGGPLEIIENGIDGLLFDGTSNDLSKKIEMLYVDENLKKKLAVDGYKKVKKKFNYKTQLDKIYKMMA